MREVDYVFLTFSKLILYNNKIYNFVGTQNNEDEISGDLSGTRNAKGNGTDIGNFYVINGQPIGLTEPGKPYVQDCTEICNNICK